jgi:hypothetical protein
VDGGGAGPILVQYLGPWRLHLACSGFVLELGWCFPRLFPGSSVGFDSLPRPSCDRAGDGAHGLGSWGCIARDHFNDPWRCGANVMGSPRGQLASSLALRSESSHVALAQDVAFGRPPRPKLSGIDVVVYRLGGDAQYVCGFSNRHDLDTPLLSDEFASMPFAKSPEDGTDTVQCDADVHGRHARGCATLKTTRSFSPLLLGPGHRW